jgi:hypothetical protein
MFLFFGTASLLALISFAQPGNSAVITETKVLNSSSSESAEPLDPPAPANRRPSGIGVDVKRSVLGIGGEVAVPLIRRSNLRGGNKFVKWLDDNAHAKSTGHCAQYFRKALEASGLDTTGRPNLAKDYGPFLQKLGFSDVSQHGYIPQTGDVVVFQSGPSPAGHVQAWDGSQWISDFSQGAKNISPYKGGIAMYMIYRFSRP